MSDEEGAPENPPTPPEGFFGYGNHQEDLTIWLHERVRATFAEHYSQLYDDTPAGVVPIIVQLVMAAMSAAEDGPGEGSNA